MSGKRVRPQAVAFVLIALAQLGLYLAASSGTAAAMWSLLAVLGAGMLLALWAA